MGRVKRRKLCEVKHEADEDIGTRCCMFNMYSHYDYDYNPDSTHMFRYQPEIPTAWHSSIELQNTQGDTQHVYIKHSMTNREIYEIASSFYQRGACLFVLVAPNKTEVPMDEQPFVPVRVCVKQVSTNPHTPGVTKRLPYTRKPRTNAPLSVSVPSLPTSSPLPPDDDDTPPPLEKEGTPPQPQPPAPAILKWESKKRCCLQRNCYVNNKVRRLVHQHFKPQTPPAFVVVNRAHDVVTSCRPGMDTEYQTDTQFRVVMLAPYLPECLLPDIQRIVAEYFA